MWFLDHGADPNARGDWDITPLSAAVRQAPMSTVRLLLERGGDVQRGQLLLFAMERELPDQLAVVDWLVRLGAPISARQFENDAGSWMENRNFGMGTPLHKAAERGKADIVAYLLEHGADDTINDTLGRTAVELAESGGFDTVVQLLQR